MSNPNEPADPLANASPEEITSALFANLVVQQTNMAFMFLGRVPHPETGEIVQDLESAKFFIDQLEMIEVKTKGNLDKREEGLLKQSLTGLRMAFVEAADGKGSAPEVQAAPQSPVETVGIAPAPVAPVESKPAAEDESRKKFSKKY
ncbi:MAG: DUF1844 domain-containing protein [Verrucomicrobiota bacterium]